MQKLKEGILPHDASNISCLDTLYSITPRFRVSPLSDRPYSKI